MAISKNVQDNEKQKFKESTSTAGQPGVVVLNPDGSSISGGSGTTASQVQGNVAHDAADTSSNPVKVGGRYKASPGTVADGDRTELLTDEYGQAKVVPVGTGQVTDRGASATDTRVAVSTTSSMLLASNGSRKEAVIFNDSAANLFVRLSSSAASATAFAYKVAAGATVIEDKYTGVITGILDSGTGNAQITEVV